MEDPIVAAILSSLLTALCTFLATLYAAVHPWRRKYEALDKSITYWVDFDYNVALDGVKESGKSALIARWMNPTTNIAALGPTTGMALHPSVQVATHNFENSDGKRYQHRYQLNFYDVGGEWLPEFGQVMIERKIRVAVLVIDPTALEASIERFSGGTLYMTYLTQNALDNLICMLIYISKCDLVSEGQLQAAEQQVRERVVRVVEHRFSEKQNLLIFRGSALTGEGFLEPQAFVARQLGYAQYLQKHKSLTNGSG